MDKISLLCRGKSLDSIDLLPKVDECVLVNSFHNELQIDKISNYVKNCSNITHVWSLGCLGEGRQMISMSIYEKYNIKKIVLPYIKECCPSVPSHVFSIKGKDDYVPVTIMSDENKRDMMTTDRYKFTSPTAGMDALLYCVNDLQKKEVNIIGMDFYDGVGYLTNSHGLTKVNDEEAIRRGEDTEMMKSFFINFVKKHEDVTFNIFTKSNFKTDIKNLNVKFLED